MSEFDNEAIAKWKEDLKRKLDGPIINAMKEFAEIEYKDSPRCSVTPKGYSNDYGWQLWIEAPLRSNETLKERDNHTDLESIEYRILVLDLVLYPNKKDNTYQFYVSLEINTNAAMDLQFHQAFPIAPEPDLVQVQVLLQKCEDILIQFTLPDAKLIQPHWENKYNYIRDLIDTRWYWNSEMPVKRLYR